MTDNKISINKRNVEAIEAPASGERVLWDEVQTGFGVRVSSKGKKTYFIYGRTQAGRQIKMKLGAHGTMTAEQARTKAKTELGKLAGGDDPAEEKRQAKAAEAKRLAIPTVAQLCDRYLEEWAEVYKRPLSIRDDRAMIATIIKPALGGKRVPNVTSEDIGALHRGMKGTPYRANRVVALVSKMFSLAVVEWKICMENPVTVLKRYDEEPRQRRLSSDELARLADALAAYPSQTAADAFRLLLLTGARSGEVLNMTWDQIDREPGTWTKPSAHKKSKREHTVPLSPGALTILERLRQRRKPGETYVFEGKGPGEHLAELKKPWATVCKAAGIDACRIHDLRHTFASLLLNSGSSLSLIGRLLGHTQTKTTQRYSHWEDEGLREATARVDAQLAALSGKSSAGAVILPLPARRQS